MLGCLSCTLGSLCWYWLQRRGGEGGIKKHYLMCERPNCHGNGSQKDCRDIFLLLWFSLFMKFLCFYCQLEWSSAKRKDSVNLLTQIQSSMLFIEMKKVSFALFHLELWDTPTQKDLLLCSIFLSISPHVFLLLGWGIFPQKTLWKKRKD